MRKVEVVETVERERERATFREISSFSNHLRKLHRVIKKWKRGIGYLAEVKEGRKRIKLLQDSLSFL